MSDDSNEGLPGQDSFIDVVCNMVGILIILVMIVGVRASRAVTAPPSGAEAALPADAPTLTELERQAGELAESEGEITRAATELVDLARQAALTDARRQQLTLVKATVEKAIEDRRGQLDDQGRNQFDVQREIAAAEIELHQLEQQRMSLLAASNDAAEIEEVECVPTPLARTVTGEEVHVRLKHGQLAVVPVDALLEEIERRGAHYLRNNLRERNQAEDVFGPIDGFRMRLSVERLAAASSPASAGAERPGVALQGVFVPTSDDLGQPVEQALLPESPFMRAVRAKRTAAPAVVVWVYPDSYAELRSIKRAMWDAGIPLAIRPLPNGQAIIFSTLGTRAAAQ